MSIIVKYSSVNIIYIEPLNNMTNAQIILYGLRSQKTYYKYEDGYPQHTVRFGFRRSYYTIPYTLNVNKNRSSSP